MNLRQKYYFLDYSPIVSLSERIIRFLLKKDVAHNGAISLSEILQHLRWYRLETKEYINKSMAIDDMFRFICQALDILTDTSLLVSYSTNRQGPPYEGIFFTVVCGNLSSDFQLLLKERGYFPLEGKKQVLTPEQIKKADNSLRINYDSLFVIAKEASKGYEDVTKCFAEMLRDDFEHTYSLMCNMNTAPYKCTFDTIYTLYDLATERVDFDEEYSDDFIQDRVVAFYGYSMEKKRERKVINNDMRKTLKEVWADKETDKGHFIGHSLGGDINENIFPQSRSFNQNKTERGKTFRRMEDYCRNHPGTFCFSRPIYFDFSIRPFLLEYGLVKSDLTLWVERFENV